MAMGVLTLFVLVRHEWKHLATPIKRIPLLRLTPASGHTNHPLTQRLCVFLVQIYKFDQVLLAVASKANPMA